MYGICHGVAPASIFHEEPEARTVINQEGIKITFYSSDIKGLISNHYARESDTGIIQIGKRCFPFGFGCSDINAGSFHIILSNKLGLSQTGFIADIDRNKQVWNHVAVSYQAEVLEKILIAGYPLSQVESRVKIKTVVKYAASIAPAFSPVIGSQLADYYIRDYQYYLDLDSQGNVIGGTWLSWDRPDFIWYKERDEFKNYWQKLNELIAD